MADVLRDRYLTFDANRGCDLVSGADVLLDAIGEDDERCGEEDLMALMEVLEHGRDGTPRWVVAEARGAAQAAGIARRAAAGARRRGFVAIAVDLYLRLRGLVEEDLRDRAMLLIGGFAEGGGLGRSALLVAAVASPRPHVLLTFRATTAPASPPVVREARAAYGPPPANAKDSRLEIPRRKLPLPADVVRHIERAGRARAFIRAGRHAAAERLLRDVGAALGRRGANSAAADTSLELGRLLVERGRASAAESVFTEAARLADAGSAPDLTALAHVWLARARTDQCRLADAESVLRAVVVTTTAAEVRTWAYASLVRCLLWQNRIEESAALPLDPPAGNALSPEMVATIGETIVRVLVTTGRIFEAGQRARSELDLAAAFDDPLAHAIAHTAYLRVACAAGDMALARAALKDVVVLSRIAHAPLRAARARLVWFDAVHRAGLSVAAGEARAALQRFVRVAPPLLRLRIEAALRCGGATGVPGALFSLTAQPAERSAPLSRLDASATSRTAILVRLAHDEEDDRAAARRVLERASGDLSTSRIEVVSADAGPMTVILAVGLGLPTTLGSRILETGMAIRHDAAPENREAGIPIRLGSRLVAALACRWPLDRSVPPYATDLIDVVAAVLAPRIDSLLTKARETARASSSIPELVGISEVMTDVRKAITRAAAAPFAVLVEGESGAGKELVARAIHQLGPRRERKFCDVNCAALPDELLESELFGHARGAFTGAVLDRAGLFEEASGGTLFLDEIADLSGRAQAKLLRVVQQQEVRRIGEAFSRPVDVRLVAAANRDMRAAAQAGHFRQDLLYRLDVIRLRLPPLRERPEDIPILAQHFWRDAAARVGSTAVLSPAVLADLSRYAWPGNVRELQNVMAALAVAAPVRGRVRPALLPPVISGATAVSSGRLDEARDQFERRFVEAALARFSGSRSRTAASLGVSRQGLLKMMARLRIQLPNER